MKFLKRTRLQHSLRFTSLIAVFVALLLLLAFPSRDSSIEVNEALTSVIEQTNSLEQALGAVNSVGGEVTHGMTETATINVWV